MVVGKMKLRSLRRNPANSSDRWTSRYFSVGVASDVNVAHHLRGGGSFPHRTKQWWPSLAAGRRVRRAAPLLRLPVEPPVPAAEVQQRGKPGVIELNRLDRRLDEQAPAVRPLPVQ